MAGRGLGGEPPTSTLILLEGKVGDSKTSGLWMPTKKAVLRAPLSTVLPEARLVTVSPPKIVIPGSLMSILPEDFPDFEQLGV